jgi:hypothetical protein
MVIAGQSIVERVWRVTHDLPDTGELVLFDEAGNRLLKLSPTGGAVWDLVDGKRSVDEIGRAVARAFKDVEPGRVNEEVKALILDLLTRGALRLHEA